MVLCTVAVPCDPHCTTKREMLAAVAMCIQFRSYLRGARFTLRTDRKSFVWLHRFKDTEGMMSRWLHTHVLQPRHVDSAPVPTAHRSSYFTTIQTNHSTVSTGSSEDVDLVPVQSGEDWIAKLDDDLSQPAAISGDSFRISTLQREDPVCITLHSWIVADEFPPWAEVKSMLPELRSLWHHRKQFNG